MYPPIPLDFPTLAPPCPKGRTTLAQIFLWKPVYQRMGAIFQMCWREVASSRDLPIVRFVSLLRHLFLAGRMRVFGSRPSSHKPGPAPRHLGQGHVRRAARSHMPWRLGSCGQLAPRSVRERPALRHSTHPRTSLPIQGHGGRSRPLPSQPSWPAATSHLPVPSSPQMLVVSHQTQRAQSH